MESLFDTQRAGIMANLATIKDLVGSYLLQSFEIEDQSGRRAPWGRNVRGLLIYADTGHMSVAINKDVERESATEAEDVLDSLLFYAGTYRVDGEIVRHQVTQASNPTRIGKEMIRHASYADGLLTLVTPPESFGRAILVWRKVKP
jgi:hypothetical protein